LSVTDGLPGLSDLDLLLIDRQLRAMREEGAARKSLFFIDVLRREVQNERDRREDLAHRTRRFFVGEMTLNQMTAKEIATALGQSRRTIYRDLETLGLPPFDPRVRLDADTARRFSLL